MESNFLDLTSTGTKRSSIKITNTRPAKRRRSISASSSTTGSSMDLDQFSRDSSVPQRTRRVGDGLDCRRPMSTSTSAGSSNNPIDLSTEDDDDDLAISLATSRPASRPRQRDRPQVRAQRISRGPEYSRQIIDEIINIDEGDNTGHEEHLRRHYAAVLAEPRQNSRPSSLRFPSQPQSARHSPSPVLHGRGVQSLRRQADRASGPRLPTNAPILVIDDDDDDDDHSLILEDGHGNRLNNSINQGAMTRNSGTQDLPVYTRGQALMHRVQSLHARGRQQQPPPPPPQPQRAPGLGLAGFVAPIMDYGYSAFDFVTGNNRYPEPYRPPTPVSAYPSLPACPAGFTRTPQDGDVLICPNCERELCIDEPTPATEDNSKKSTRSPAKNAKTKQDAGRDEVWVVKACGHAYCGACARARKRAPSKNAKPKASPKGKGKDRETIPAPAPFSTCSIKGCGEKLSSKAHMIQLFL